MVEKKQTKNELMQDTIYFLFLKSENTVKNKRKLEEIYWEYKKRGLSSKESWEKAKKSMA